MKIAIAQMKVVPGNIRLNLARILELILGAVNSGADIVVFPELSTSGYLLGDLFEDQGFIEEIAMANETIREASKSIAVIWGSLVIDKNRKNEDGRARKYNAVCVAQNSNWVSNGVLSGFMPKTNLPKYRIFDDERHFYPAAKLALEKGLTIEGLSKPFWIKSKSGEVLRCGLTICEDLWEDDYQIKPSLIYKQNGTEILINVSCSPWTTGKCGARERMLEKRARDGGMPIVYAATVGLENNAKNLVWFDGGSSVTANDGGILWRAKDNEENLTVLNLNDIPVSSGLKKKKAEIEEIHDALIGAMSEYFAPFPKVVVGLSGGIDSAVTAVLLVEALGKDRVLGINMPTRFNSETTKRLALELAGNLGIEYKVMPIEDILGEFGKAMNKAGYRYLPSLAIENEQARIRGAGILAFVAQAEHGVFAATGNKTEIALNYFTLYGDGAGAAAFLGDLWKGQVYELAYFCNLVSGREIIPEEVIRLRPSAELSSEQNVDEGKGDPIYYPYHDKLLQAFMEQRRDPEWILHSYMEGTLERDLGCSEEAVEELFRFLGGSKTAFIENLEWCWRQFHTSFKHAQTPPVFLASRRAFGFDYREFIGDAYFTDAYRKLKQKFLT